MTQVELPQSDTVRARQRCHILDLDAFSRFDIETMLNTADSMKEILSRNMKQVPILRGKTVVHLFHDAHPQTRLSFELAAHTLSAQLLTFTPQAGQLSEHSTFVNTVRVLQSLSVDVLVVCHAQAGTPYLAARHFQGALINAGDGFHADPSQALVDLYTIRDKRGHVEQLKVVLVGDVLHSRVARSNLWGLTRMGAYVTLCAPATLLGPARFWQATWPDVKITSRLDEALEGADVVMVLPLEHARIRSGLVPSLREYQRCFTLTARHLDRLGEHVLILHSGPLNDPMDIAPEILASSQSVIHDQIANGVAIRMAMLYSLAGDCHDTLA